MQQPKTKEQAMNYNILSTNDTSLRAKRAGFLAIMFQPWQMLFDAMAMRKTVAALSALDGR
jgi:hypothetical protein